MSFPSSTFPAAFARGLRGGFVALVFALLGLPGLARAQIAVGDAFPNLATMGLTEGKLPDSAGRVMLVDFWASWCAPCKASFPAFSRLHTAFAEKGFVIVAVSVDEKPAAYAAFVKKWQPPFTTVLDQAQNLVRAVKVPAMPTSYLIGRDGRVRSIHQGFHGAATERELQQSIEKLLAEQA
ncbi:TlpA family protein disulfide reductase [Opitutus terrae]|uniref:Redoxin domain protein n=1 Tax=Opitutus terrae (strain DSM 11246 / JCM 15787 / PB90-1) TaxID=452637 RepID=B1ZTT9_OPITP|nr:TlpA disulfide reductase family protein [Opitutus terrae]ACB74896.1 Redoxin domain protein [Opitutus terrae PB90-1]